MIGRVYKIVCGLTNDIYVGSSKQELRYRWRDHKYDYKKFKNGKHNKLSVYPLFQKYGIDNFKIILIKEYEVCDKEHLKAYETLWINKLKSINKVIPFRIRYLSDKLYRANNKEHLEEKRKYYRDNIDACKLWGSTSITCECGYTYTQSHKARHMKTARHLKKIQQT